MKKTVVISREVEIEVDDKNPMYCSENCTYRFIDITQSRQRDGCSLFNVAWLGSVAGQNKRIRCNKCLEFSPITKAPS